MRGKPRVVALCARAARRGIAVGMALAEARALAGDLVARAWDDERIARAALEVTTSLLAASPRVAWERGLGAWWVDAAGLGDETALARRLARLAGGHGYGPARIGIADAAIAAWAASCARPRHRPAPPAAIVPPGGDAAFLRPFPIGLLDLDDELAGALTALGLTTVGRFAALDPGEVESRFGPSGLAAHRRARGHDTRGPTAPRDDALPAVTADLGGAVATTEPLLFVLKGALASLGEALRLRGLAARELTITLTLDDGTTAARAVRPARPSSQPGALFDHVRAALEDWILEGPVAALELRATLTVPASGEQGDLLAPRWADPAALAGAFDRIRAREGADAVAVPEARDAHLPADAGAWRCDGAPAPARAGRVAERVTPPHGGGGAALRRLAEAAPVRVRLGRAGLEAFRHGDAWYDVTAWAGPERLTPRWWQDAGDARDYYTMRARDGSLWLLYRGVRERTWFLEGWWD